MYLHIQDVNSFVDKHTDRKVNMTDPDSAKRSDEAWERIKYKFPITHPEAPYNTAAANFPTENPFSVNLSPPEKTINLDPALERLKEKRPQISSGFTEETLKQAINDAKAVRQEALNNAKQALEEAFAPRFNQMISEKLKEEEMKNIVPQKPTEPFVVPSGAYPNVEAFQNGLEKSTEPKPAEVGDVTEGQINEIIKELEPFDGVF